MQGYQEFAAWPVALYGVVLLLAGTAYFILSRLLAAHHGKNSVLAKALGEDRKGKLSIAIYAAVALMWLYPDRRFENVLSRLPRS